MTEDLQDALDEWFPTIIRYAGLAFGAIQFGVWAVTERWEPAFITLATGMILFKTVAKRRE
jgi:hypothetical protein